MLNFKEIFSVSLILFSVIDILGSIPVIIDLKKRTGVLRAAQATLVAGLIMVAFLFAGESILKLFGLDTSSFAIAGALVIFFLGLEMILGIHFFKGDLSGSGSSASIVPIAFPIIARSRNNDYDSFATSRVQPNFNFDCNFAEFDFSLFRFACFGLDRKETRAGWL